MTTAGTDIVIVDTGPLVALFNRRDRHHQWTVETLAATNASLLTCEPVITETCHLLARDRCDQTAPLQALKRGAIKLEFELAEHHNDIARLMQRYRNIPMSLADACLVRMTELHEHAPLLTLDSDFGIYRRFTRRRIPLLKPG